MRAAKRSRRGALSAPLVAKLDKCQLATELREWVGVQHLVFSVKTTDSSARVFAEHLSGERRATFFFQTARNSRQIDDRIRWGSAEVACPAQRPDCTAC